MVDSMKNLKNTGQLTLAGSNQTTLERLYDGYYDRVYAYCVYRLFCKSAAEDVTSTIFLAAAKAIESVSCNEPDAHVRWLYRITINQCNSYIRKHLRRRRLFEQYQQQHNHHQNEVESSPDWTEVYAALMQLKEIEQTVITLRFFEEMTHEKIAVIINKRSAAVRVILHRGLKKLRKLLNPAGSGLIDRGVSHD